MHSYSFYFSGLVGHFMGPRAQQHYSLVSTTKAILDTGSSMGYIFLQAVVIIFSLIVPLAYLLALLILWITPLSLNKQKGLFVFAEILGAWASLEVLIVAILVCVMQVSLLCSLVKRLFMEDGGIVGGASL